MNWYNYNSDEFFNSLPLASKIAYGVFALAICVLSIVALWKIFVKAGEKGWKAIIPFYNVYILFKISWETKYFWTYLILSIVIGVLSGIGAFVAETSVWGILITVAISVLSIALLCFSIILDIKLSKAFGHGVGFAIGLIFLSFIFELILAFDNSQYIGNQPDVNNESQNQQ